LLKRGSRGATASCTRSSRSKKSKQRELEGLKTTGMVLSLQVFDIAHGRCGRQAATPLAGPACWCSVVLVYMKWRGVTTRRNPICGAPFWGLVAHLACATHIKPQVTFICGARPCAPRIWIVSVAHPIMCATHSICGAPHLGAPRIRCATDIKNGAPQICFPFYFFRKYSKNTQYTAEIYSI
jgi:hypothetical protein